MSSTLFANLVLGNLPHLIGVVIHVLIAIVLAVLCYKIFSAVIPLNTGIDASSDDVLCSVILAVGIIIGISLIVAASSVKPTIIPPFPKDINLTRVKNGGNGSSSSASGCGSGAAAPVLAAEPAPVK